MIDSVRAELRAGSSLEETLESLPLAESFLPAMDSPLAQARALMKGLHLWNVKRAYQELKEVEPVSH